MPIFGIGLNISFIEVSYWLVRSFSDSPETNRFVLDRALMIFLEIGEEIS